MTQWEVTDGPNGVYDIRDPNGFVVATCFDEDVADVILDALIAAYGEGEARLPDTRGRETP